MVKSVSLFTRRRRAYDLPDSYMVMSLEWSHLIVQSSKSFNPWAPLGGGGGGAEDWEGFS